HRRERGLRGRPRGEDEPAVAAQSPNGLNGLGLVETITLFVSKYSSSVSSPSSRPKPDCLKPPNGIPGNAVYGMLIPTVPALIARASRCPRAGSPVQTVAISPYLTSFAIRIAA